jgi:Tol biopolymer transport system component
MGLFDYPPSGAPAPFVAGPLDEAFAITRDGAHVLFSRVLPTDQVELWQAPLAGGAPSATGDNSVQPTKGLAIAGDRIVWSTCRTQTVLALLRSSSVATRELRPEPLFPPSEWEDVGSVGMPSDPAKLVLLSNRSGRRQPWVVDVKGAQPARMLSTGSLEPANPAVSADGRWLAFEAIGSGIWIVPMDGSAAPRALTRRTGDRSPTFARDATAVYFETSGPSGRRAIAALPLDAVEGAAPEVILDGALRPAASPVDGRLAYVEQAGAEETGSPRVLDTLTGKSRPLSSALGAGEHPGVAWSPDGSRIAVADGPQQIVEFDSAHGNVLRRYAGADAIDGLTYLGRDVVVVRGVWGGDLWIARDAPAGPADSATGAR